MDPVAVVGGVGRERRGVVIEVGDLGAGVVAELETHGGDGGAGLAPELVLERLDGGLRPDALAEQRRWRSRSWSLGNGSRQDERHTHLLRDADVGCEGGEIGVGDEQEDAVVSRQLQLRRRHGCPLSGAAVLRVCVRGSCESLALAASASASGRRRCWG